MPASPEFGDGLAVPVVELYLDTEATLLRGIADRIERGIESDNWQERKVAEVPALQREVRAEISKLEREGPKAIRKAVTSAHERGASEADQDLESAGNPEGTAPVPPAPRRSHLDELTDRGTDTVRNTHLRIMRQTDDAYRRIIEETARGVSAGSLTRRQAAQIALRMFLARGITGFIDSTGRAWNLASYVEMATRAVTASAAIDGHVSRLTSRGHDLAIVSDAPGECSACRPWEGRVISISGVTRGYLPGGVHVEGTLGDAEASGLYHPGCRHSLGLFIPGHTRPYGRTEDPAGYAARQEQRYLERGVRGWKRREAIAITPEERALAKAKLDEWRRRLRKQIAAHDLKRLRHRESIGSAL